jgi:hypothetical protein
MQLCPCRIHLLHHAAHAGPEANLTIDHLQVSTIMTRAGKQDKHGSWGEQETLLGDTRLKAC